jgi:hypothetical protein
MTGTITLSTRRQRGQQMSDFKAVQRIKSKEGCSTAAAIRMVAKMRGKTRGSVQASYYATAKIQAATTVQPIKPTTKPKPQNPAKVAAQAQIPSLAGAIESMEREVVTLRNENTTLRNENDDLRKRLDQIKNCF